MTILVQRNSAVSATLAGNQLLELQVPKLLDALPLLDDENGTFTLPLEAQAQPLRFELRAWEGYEDDYRTLTGSGYTNLQVACQAVRDQQRIGDPVIVAMVADSEQFRVELQLPAPSPLRDREFDIAYDLWIVDVGNVARSNSTLVYYDRTAPGENAPFTFSGPSLIDREHLEANAGFARLELPRWADLRLEDQVQVFFRPTGGALPALPTAIIAITQANRLLPNIPLLIAERLLVSGSFEVSCQLRDRAGNLNRASNLLPITVDLVGGEELLLPIKRIEPDFVSIFGWINCSSLQRATLDPWPDPGIPRGMRFRVPLPQDGVSVGDLVQISWQMCRDSFGRMPISEPSLLPFEPTPMRADGIVVMPFINELIVEELRKVFEPGRDPFEGSVNVAYRVRTQAGRWRTSAVEVVNVSLQRPGGGVCSGPWITEQVWFPQNRSLIMGAYEGVSTGGPAELKAEEERRQEQEAKAAFEAERNRIIEQRSSSPTAIGKVRSASGGLFEVPGPLADEFTIVGALPNNAVVRPNEIPLTAYVEGNENDYVYIEVPRWAESGGMDYEGSRDQVRLIFNGVPWRYEGEDGEPEEDDPAEEARRGEPFSLPYPIDAAQPFPVQIQITPKMLEFLGEGIHRISYMVMNDQALNPDPSLPQRITLDRIPPSNGVPPLALLTPTVPPPMEAGVPIFTGEYLDANATVTFPIPPYVVARAGDRIQLLNGSDDAEIVPLTVIWPETDAVAPAPQISVSAATLRALGNGSHQLVYVLADRPGSPSGKSIGYNFTVRLEAQPGNLLAPEINNPDSTPKVDPIVRADLFPVTDLTKVVDIAIPAYDGSQPTDLIEVTWTDGAGTPRIITPFPFSTGKVSVNWTFLSVPDSRALYTASVTYRVLRNGQPFGPSPAASPRVDLRIVGPVNPNEPDPVNPALTLLTVVGGSGRSPDNFITPLDHVVENDGTIRVLDGTIKFTVYEGAEAGHVVTIFYGGQQVTTLTLSTEVPGEVVDFNLSGAIIQAQGNGVIPANYTIKETAAATNFQQSLNTQVNVSAITVLMRNFVWFDYTQSVPAARQNQRPGTTTNLTGVVNCSSMPWNNINLILRDFRAGDPERPEEVANPPVSVSLQAGDFVTVFWEYHSGSSLGDLAAPTVERALPEVQVPAGFNPAAGVRYPIRYANDLFNQVSNPPTPVADSIVCRFSVRRGTNSWISRKCLVKYNTRQGGLVCTGWVAS
ncbi:hypothetical protein [Pseudomonas entomophila]|uniref:Uncharacterized protein n=2 Tax=Pseudomonas entomophila TaxID=312306 RepID=Q1I5T7_PSEE4|nr:hypothetical protein [Pseudomonas entomophila]WMW07273.1 hypothetical protein RAH46_08020 [Pseudomonas entomophila]CAK16998.1 hypothetical protein PSEEN4311 [Pseudomonas entomophila L48]